MSIREDVQIVDPAASAVFHRYPARSYPVMVRAEGVRLYDASGREYLDGNGGGAAVAVLGYGNAHVREAASAQMAELPFIHNVLFTNRQQERLAERLAGHAPSGLNRTYFVQGGAEANEAALRLIRSYHVDRGEPNRDIVVTHAAAYHGSTIGTLSLSGRKNLQHPMGPWILPWEHFAPFHCYRCPYGQEYATCNIDCARILWDIADRVGPERIAAFMMEPIPASAAPGLVPPPEFLPMVRKWCDEVGALMVLDEVVTGMGRTGRWFASEHWGVVPDAMTIAKGLGAGYAPIGALVARDSVYEVIANASKDFEHGHTLNGNPVSCAAANAVLDVIEGEDLVARSAALGSWIRSQLAESLADVNIVGEVRGLGTLIGIEFVADRESGAILDPGLGMPLKVIRAGWDEGVFMGCSGNNTEVGVGESALLAPAYVMSDTDAELLVERVTRAIRRVATEIAPELPRTRIPLSLGHPRDRARERAVPSVGA